MRTALFSALVLSIFVGLLGCGKDEGELPEKPQLILDRDSVSFGLEFGRAYLGTEPQESLFIENKGLNNLTITDVTYAGPAVFRFDGPTKLELKGLERTYIRVFFKPTAEKAYEGKLTITSNAENAPSKEITLAGEGVKPLPADAGQ